MSGYPAVVGIDPSLTSSGVAVAPMLGNLVGEVRTHRFESKGKATDTWEQTHDRIGQLRRRILGVVPIGSLVVIEAPAFSKTAGKAFDRACLWRDITRDLRDDFGATVVTASIQTRAKYATGYGAGANAGKDRVLAAAIKRYPHIDIQGNDIADAVLFLAIGARLIGHPIESSLPQANLAAMDKVRLPLPTPVRA